MGTKHSSNYFATDSYFKEAVEITLGEILGQRVRPAQTKPGPEKPTAPSLELLRGRGDSHLSTTSLGRVHRWCTWQGSVLASSSNPLLPKAQIPPGSLFVASSVSLLFCSVYDVYYPVSAPKQWCSLYHSLTMVDNAWECWVDGGWMSTGTHSGAQVYFMNMNMSELSFFS